MMSSPESAPRQAAIWNAGDTPDYRFWKSYRVARYGPEGDAQWFLAWADHNTLISPRCESWEAAQAFAEKHAAANEKAVG